MIKAVFFDMDGTLVNSMEDLAIATNYAIKKRGFPERPVENFNMYAGDGIYMMIKRALAPKEVSEEELIEIRNDFFAFYEKNCTVTTYVYEGVDWLVKTLKEKGYKVGCITNKVEKIANDIINHFFGGMDVVFGQVDGRPHKPDPYCTLEAMKMLGVKPEECAFIGDSGVDMKTGVNSGAHPLGVLWGFRTREELVGDGAEFIVETAKEAMEIIENI